MATENFTRSHFRDFLIFFDGQEENMSLHATVGRVVYLLMASKTRWSIDTILDMLHGKHGERVAAAATKAVIRGLAKPVNSNGADWHPDAQGEADAPPART